MAELEAKLAALDKSQAVIEFTLDGVILHANPNFLNALGYELSEIKGKNHSMFVEPAYRDSPAYKEFWAKLRVGEAQVAQFKRIGKGGREVWIEASYNPLRGADGKPFKVVKFAIDVTGQKMELADLKGQVDAINKAQAVISFELDGTIIEANQNFLDALGYSLPEIKGKHHSMFVEPVYRDSSEYKEFWNKLRAGQYQAAQYKRIGKGGREVWIEASYNPILTPDGKPYKVVKYATDITKQIELLGNLKQLIDKNFGEIDSAIGQTTAQANAAAQAASETSGNVQMVASAAEELAASVSEIAQSMAKSRAASDSAYDRVNTAGEFTRKLADTASAMGGIVGLIQNIAGQINLLALNATIESARAGEAGRGFAVVANEVKNLANQAARATEQISSEIDAIQTVSGNVVQALGDIRSSIDSVREFVTATAGAVDEQSAVTRDMSANMQNASGAVSVISQNINEITAAALQAEGAVSKTK
ncbi:MAG TPA: PAS domain-containing methyl-accepting chemotaxis protein, partial [Magnetospirillum sp.]|nr:PAS domain-containing methyl-accepting chemotaxis protein [Magnetospirillum sp.]